MGWMSKVLFKPTPQQMYLTQLLEVISAELAVPTLLLLLLLLHRGFQRK